MLRHLLAIICAVFIALSVMNVEIPGTAALSGAALIWLVVLPFAFVVLLGLFRGEA